MKIIGTMEELKAKELKKLKSAGCDIVLPRSSLVKNIPKLLSDIGFVDIEIGPFQEAEQIDPAECPFWRFPWTRISMHKPN